MGMGLSWLALDQLQTYWWALYIYYAQVLEFSYTAYLTWEVHSLYYC